MNEFEQIESIIGTLTTIINSMKSAAPTSSTIEDVVVTVEELNKYFYHTDRLRFQNVHDLNNPDGYTSFIEEIELLIDTWKQTMLHRSLPDIDAQFWDIYEFF